MASPLVKLLLEEVGHTLTQLQRWPISGMAFKLVMKMQIIAACLGKSNDLPRPKGVDGKALGGGVLCTNMLEKAYKQVRGAEAQRKL